MGCICARESHTDVNEDGWRRKQKGKKGEKESNTGQTQKCNVKESEAMR